MTIVKGKGALKSKAMKPIGSEEQSAANRLRIIVPFVSIAIALCGTLLSLDGAATVWETIAGSSPPNAGAIEQDSGDEFQAALTLEFFNRLDVPVDTFWKDYAGEEQFWFRMEPFSYTGNISSIKGHVWSFRLASPPFDLLFDEFIDLSHCGRIHVAPSEHLEALRNYCQKTGRAVIGNWPRAPVVRHLPDVASAKPGQKSSFVTQNTHFHEYEQRLTEQTATMQVEVVSTSPHMLKVEGFLSDEECDHLIELSQNRMLEGASDDEASSAWLEHGETPIVAAITRRLFELMGFQADVETFYFAEKLQISRWKAGQEYLPHYDAMDLTTSQRNLPHNRFATVMIYLNDVDEADGGADVWPRGNGANEFVGHGCDAALRVQPRRGTVVVLYSMFEDGVIDEASLHGSCPIVGVAGAEKWTSNMYFWDPFVQWSPETLTN